LAKLVETTVLSQFAMFLGQIGGCLMMTTTHTQFFISVIIFWIRRCTPD